jgi:hypothetical protein
MKGRLKLTMITLGFLTLSSCKTYYIPLDSFKQQFAGIDSTKLKDVQLGGGGILMVSGNHYLANPITTIKCTDKNGKPATLKNGPSIEARFTYGEDNRRTIFYFDQIFVTDSTVTGVQSRFMPSIRKTIPLNSVKKIEVQDGKKNYHYVNSH